MKHNYFYIKLFDKYEYLIFHIAIIFFKISLIYISYGLFGEKGLYKEKIVKTFAHNE